MEDAPLWDLLTVAKKLDLRLELAGIGILHEASEARHDADSAITIDVAYRSSGERDHRQTSQVHVRFPGGVTRQTDS